VTNINVSPPNPRRVWKATIKGVKYSFTTAEYLRLLKRKAEGGKLFWEDGKDPTKAVEWLSGVHRDGADSAVRILWILQVMGKLPEERQMYFGPSDPYRRLR
jgi:hypothetical protein